ncbi:restriction endonuclease subunit S [Micromonospora lupini]|uniref:Restriction modification system DNA specificity domain n=1 Tax=Micromonospora lupini str. Lupac 08 TaxID=1150864 RepID=I0L1V7_9ACTN|nr:restriction endonuclease subunit S [Micromonospora lupini]CCH17804.1 Restriction modification system DNA specificity domain [Micromonospora lupini str. Lupac 08]
MSSADGIYFSQLPLRRFLREIVDGPFGSSLTSSHYSDEGARVVRLGNIGAAHFRGSDAVYIPHEYFRQLQRHEVKPGDLLIAGLGDERHPVGRACIAPEGLGPAIVKADCFRARLDERRVTHRFAAWALSSSLVSDQVAALSRGSTRTRINLDVAREIQIPVPSPEEQRRIADYLDAETARIDNLMQQARRGLTMLDERRSATVFNAVTGRDLAEKKKGSSLGWVDSLPESWPVIPLKWAAKIGSGHTPSRTRPEYWENCTIPWISLFDVGRMRNPRQERLSETTQKISELGVANSSACLHPAGTVVLSRTASVGFSTIMDADMAVSQHFVTWTSGERLSPEYLLYTLRAMWQYFESVQVGTTNVTVFMPDLNAIRVPVPPTNVQRSIVNRIRADANRIDALSDTFGSQIKLLTERRQALITAAVTGQVDVSTASERGIEA